MDILETLQKYKEYAESQGLIVYAIALKGSQNYNLSDDESDIDANLVFIPTLSQLRNQKAVKFTFPEGEVTCHDIYSFAHIVAKGNPQWVEVCNSDYTIGDLSMFRHFKLNPSALKGMFMEKVHAFDKLYPSSKKAIEKFGYAPKQLHHLVRLYDTLALDVVVLKYYGEDRDYMMDIKRGRQPSTKEEAFKLRDEYVTKLETVYTERKLAYELQEVDYDKIDTIVIKHLVNYYHHLID